MDKVTPLLSGEVNKLIKVAIFIFLAVATFTIYSNVQNHEFLNLWWLYIYKGAIDHYKKTLKIRPDLVPAQKNLEMALRAYITK